MTGQVNTPGLWAPPRRPGVCEVPSKAVAALAAGAVPASSSTKPPPQEDPDEIRPGVQFGWDNEWYEVSEEIGSGAAARVFACVHLATGENLAVKVINLQRLALLGDFDGHMQMLDREVSILRGLHHERIVDLRHVHKTEKFYFLIMERVWGGELFHQIVQCKRFSEVEARYVFRQLLEGVAYMHSKNVIHRDLKPENILIALSRQTDDGSGQLRDVKIADFGLSKAITEGVSMAKTFVGTPQYWAPEVLDVTRGGGSYDKAVDFWGLGTVLFVMLVGRYPFDRKEVPLEDQISAAAFNTSTARWGNISPAAKDLVGGLLRVVPAERLCVEKCFRHPWVLGEAVIGPEMACWQECESTSVSPRSPLPAENSPPKDPPAAAGGSPRENSASTPGPSGRRRRRGHGGSSQAQNQGEKGGRTANTLPAVAETAPLSSVESAEHAAHTNGQHKASVPNGHHDSGTSKGDVRMMWRFNSLGWIIALAAVFMGSLRQLILVPDPSAPDAGGNWSGGLVQAISQRAGWRPPNTARSIGSTTTSYESGQAGQAASNSSALWSVAGQEVLPVVGFEDACGEEETIFRLNELLKLQVSITYSLQMASLAFRHTDPSLADKTQSTFRQAHELFQYAADVIHRYARIAAQVREAILPDLQLAIEEMQPELAASLLRMAKKWVADMKARGEETRRKHNDLEDSVLELLRDAQGAKRSTDQRLADAWAAGGARGRPSMGGLSICRSPEKDKAALTQPPPAVGSRPADALNGWTRRLFERLEQLARARGVEGVGVETSKSSDLPAIGMGEMQEPFGSDAWATDVLDLLFMAPGVSFSTSTLKQLDFIPKVEDSSAGEDDEDAEEEADEAEDDQEERSPTTEMQSAAQSSAALMRALRELRRVDTILQGVSDFWANMDATVQRLAEMKEHAEILVNYTASSHLLKERFMHRMAEYSSFWTLLEKLCRQYYANHQKSTSRTRDFVRELGDTADLADIAVKTQGLVLNPYPSSGGQSV
mmetsp:Transcript_51544/g.122612  ORF Transcript_51544/g.122612 Transcript_51544/m.122612 type:complete len:1000 (-) Transcript_51544:54-3053(-)